MGSQQGGIGLWPEPAGSGDQPDWGPLCHHPAGQNIPDGFNDLLEAGGFRNQSVNFLNDVRQQIVTHWRPGMEDDRHFTTSPPQFGNEIIPIDPREPRTGQKEIITVVLHFVQSETPIRHRGDFVTVRLEREDQQSTECCIEISNQNPMPGFRPGLKRVIIFHFASVQADVANRSPD